MSKRVRTGAVIATCGLVGAVAGIAGSAAAPSKKSPKISTSHPRDHHRAFPGRPPFGGPGMMGPVHSEAVVLNRAGDAFITVTSDAGILKTIAGNDLTIHEGTDKVDYKDVTVTVPDDAKVIRNHDEAKLSDLKVDDHVRVIASPEETIVIAEDDAWLKQEQKRWKQGPPGFRGGPGGPGRPGRGHGRFFPGPPPPPPAPGGGTS